MATEPQVLTRFACFEDLSENQLKAVAGISNSVCYMKDHVLFEEGEYGACLYLLIDGDVEVFFQSPITGELKVDSMCSEEVLGCAALAPPYRYTATQKCLSDVEVLEIQMDELRDLIEQDPDIGLKLQQYIIKILTNRILTIREKFL